MEFMNSTSSMRADLQQSPLEKCHVVLDGDGASMRPHDETITSGYAVDDDGRCLRPFRLPVNSAQAAQ